MWGGEGGGSNLPSQKKREAMNQAPKGVFEKKKKKKRHLRG